MITKISTNKAPGAIGPYSQAVVFGNILFTSGQIAINPASGNVEESTIEGQTEQVIRHFFQISRMVAPLLKTDLAQRVILLTIHDRTRAKYNNG